NVGIGTTSPANKFVVAGSGNLEIVGGSIFFHTAAEVGSAWLGASGNGAYIQSSGSGYVPGGDNTQSLGILSQRFNSINIGTGVSTFAGNVGVGSTTPFAQFAIHAANGNTNTTLFAVASSTASATTTLFAISNTGVVTLSGLS